MILGILLSEQVEVFVGEVRWRLTCLRNRMDSKALVYHVKQKTEQREIREARGRVPKYVILSGKGNHRRVLNRTEMNCGTFFKDSSSFSVEIRMHKATE